MQSREDRLQTPHQAWHFLDALRGLFEWAKEAQLADDNPTVGVTNPTRENADGFEAWRESDVTAFEACWPRGSHERLWLRVLAANGLRRGDAVVFGRQHVKDGWAPLCTEKTGWRSISRSSTSLSKRSVTGRPGIWLTSGESPGGRSRKKASATCSGSVQHRRRAQVSARTARAHGDARRREGTDAGRPRCGVQLADGRMASQYTRKKDRQRLARSGADKIRNAQSPHLKGAAPAPKKSERAIKRLEALYLMVVGPAGLEPATRSL